MIFAETSVYRMVQKGQIPAFKVRERWQFRLDDFDRWIDEQEAAVKGTLGKGALDV